MHKEGEGKVRREERRRDESMLCEAKRGEEGEERS